MDFKNVSNMVTTLSPVSATNDNTDKSWFMIAESLLLKLYDAIIGFHESTFSEHISPEGIQGLPSDTTLHSKPALFNYFLSPYAGACMLLAVVLNRTVTYAQARHSINLRSSGTTNDNNNNSTFKKKFAPCFKAFIRIVMLVLIARGLLETLLQFAIINKEVRPIIERIEFLKTSEISSVPVFLWNTFVILGASQFLETLIASASGTSAIHDSGFTLFEQSLAFHEVQFLKYPNEQVLAVVAFSLISQLVIHATALMKVAKYQLIPSSVLSLSFLTYYVHCLYNGSIIEFPSVAIVSVIPQLMVIFISVLCFIIYYAAVCLANGRENLSITPVIDNLLQTLNLQLSDDFNSTVMKLGYVMFTTAADEEYVHQMNDVVWKESTYLEEDKSTKNGYLREYQDDPEINISSKETSDINNDPLAERFWKDWSLFKKFINFYRFGYALVLMMPKIYKLGFKKNKNTNKNGKTENLKKDGSSAFKNEEDLDEDYRDDDDDDLYEIDPEEYNSDYESDLDESLNSISCTNTESINKVSALEELFSAPESIISLLKPVTPEQITLNRTLQTHLESESRLTRSKFCKLDSEEPLKSLIFERRKLISNNTTVLDDQEEQRDMTCAVCRCAPRSIIIWPCRCFALCDACRLGLGVRGFKICCCCRAPVEGFSKVYLP